MSRRVACLFVWIIFLLFARCSSKEGCTDPHSVRYDPDAKIDDGSCTYPSLDLKPTPFRELHQRFEENSALHFADDRIWTVVDKEGENVIYGINLYTGGPKETILAKGVSSVNFEALTSSETDFYIGDIGNNQGDRQDLVIYKLPRPVPVSMENAAEAEAIRFYYPEQKDFSNDNSTNFDAEAIVYKSGYIYLFTKNNSDNKTRLYEIPATAGNHAARLRGIFDVQGRITDADISDDGTRVILSGHNNSTGQVFCWLFSDFSGSDFFMGSKTRIMIGQLKEIGQVEGITFYDDENVFISNEKNHGVLAYMYHLDISTIQ